MPNSFLQSEFRNSSPASSRYHIIPVPYEATVSYGGGCARGPEAILEASMQLEKIAEGMEEPGLFGIHTADMLSCPPEDLPPEVFSRIAVHLHNAADCGAVPIMLGGEHSITNASLDVLKDYRNPEEVGILQFDAHMDLRDSYSGTKWSHASVMRRAAEAGYRIFQIGVRNYCAEELEARTAYNVSFCDASDVHRLRCRHEGLKRISLPESFPKHIYISFDLDCFDASLMPATGTPEPGGLFWWDAVELLAALARGRTILGADVVELAPKEQFHHCSYTAAKLTYLLMGLASPGLSPL